jgi:hypothetical protein
MKEDACRSVDESETKSEYKKSQREWFAKQKLSESRKQMFG